MDTEMKGDLEKLIEARDWLPEGHMMLVTDRQIVVVYPDGRIVVEDLAAILRALAGKKS
jgi:hypothetical protein